MEQNTLLGSIIKERYKIEEVIGNGGFAVTYKGTDQANGDTVAIKECRHIKPKELERIREEAQTLRELSGSQGIVHIRDYIEEADAAYIIMDYAKGVTLKNYVTNGEGMQSGTVLSMFLPIMKALAEIHDKGLLHRDISPDNIIITQDHTLTLLDFGAARSISDTQDEKTITMILKPGYAPEEQYRSLEAQGTWTDVYALCATMYFCVTRTAPIDSLQRMYEDTLKSPSELGINISQQFEEVLMQGLALRSENRIHSMQELLTRLAEAESYPHVTEQKTIRKNDTQRKRSQNKFSKGILAVIIMGMLLCVAAMIIFSGRREGGSSSDEAYLYCSDQLITQEDIQAFRRNSVLESITFDTCEISDERMQQLAELEQVRSLSFDDCYGFASYEPLSQMVLLDSLSVSVYDESLPVFDGNRDFPVDFPKIRYLTLRINGFDGGNEFLTRFKKLEYLSIYNAGNYDDLQVEIADLDFLSGLPSLHSFTLSDIKILNSDLSSLSACSLLSSLDLSNTGIEVLDGIETASGLSYLCVPENRLESLEPLKELTRVNYLDVSNNQLTTLDGIEQMEVLHSLYAADNRLMDLQALNGMKSIETLDVEGNQLESLSGCEALIQMTDLNAGRNRIGDLEGIQNSTSLKTLKVKENELTSISLLEGKYPELETVDVAGNQLTEIDALSECPKLKACRADDNRLTSLKGLEHAEELYVASAYDNQISDISALTGKTGLQYVDLGKNEITDMTPLSSMEGNDLIVFLEDNLIEDAGSLPKKNSYRFISLQGNPLPDYQTMDKLLVESIYLPDTGNGNYELLKEGHMDSLYMVDVELGNQARLKREFDEADIYLNLLTNEEAEENMEEMREFQRSM